ncbi:MAG: AAA family ATPase [Campylobacterota bacterium]
MIKKIDIENFMQLKDQTVAFGSINIIAGVNDTGKTSLLKLLYASVKAREEAKNKNIENFIDHFSTKLLNVFDIDKLGDLVTKREDTLKVDLFFDDRSSLDFSFSNKATKNIKHCSKLDNNDFELQATFLPPKEVLTIRKLIRTTVEMYDFKGYDDTYYDLVKALDVPVAKGALAKGFREADKELEKSLKGRIVQNSDEFVFQKGKQKFSISLTAEGVKKIGIFNQLLKNKTIDKNTVLIIDEPEVALHPAIIQKVVKILFDLSQVGVQIFIATHSYFVVKAFHLLAIEKEQDICFFNMKNEENIVTIEKANLKEGMPANEIVDSSIDLFNKENSIKIKKLGI